MSYRWAVTRAAAASRARSSGWLISSTMASASAPRVALRHDARVAAVGENIQQAVGIGGNDRLARGQRFERRQRRSFPERREHAQVERAEHRGDVARESDEHEPIAEAELLRLRFERFAQRALAYEKEPRVRLLVRGQAARRRPDTSSLSNRAAW